MSEKAQKEFGKLIRGYINTYHLTQVELGEAIANMTGTHPPDKKIMSDICNGKYPHLISSRTKWPREFIFALVYLGCITTMEEVEYGLALVGYPLSIDDAKNINSLLEVRRRESIDSKKRKKSTGEIEEDERISWQVADNKLQKHGLLLASVDNPQQAEDISRNGEIKHEEDYSDEFRKNYWIGLPSLDSVFVGRKDEIDQVRSAIFNGKSITIHGPTGAGKTQLLIRALYDDSGVNRRKETDELFDGAIYLDLSGFEDLDSVLQHIFYQLDSDKKQESLLERFKLQVVQELARRRLIVILDSLHKQDYCEELIRIIKQTHIKSYVLVTINRTYERNTNESIQLRGLGSHDGAQALIEWSNCHFTCRDRDILESFSNHISGLPKATKIIAENASKRRVDVIKMEDDLVGFDVNRYPDGSFRSVRTTGSKWEKIVEEHFETSGDINQDELASILSIIGIFQNVPICNQIICGFGIFNETIEKMFQYSLFDRSGNFYYVSHNLIYLYARLNAKETSLPTNFYDRVLKYYSDELSRLVKGLTATEAERQRNHFFGRKWSVTVTLETLPNELYHVLEILHICTHQGGGIEDNNRARDILNISYSLLELADHHLDKNSIDLSSLKTTALSHGARAARSLKDVPQYEKFLESLALTCLARGLDRGMSSYYFSQLELIKKLHLLPDVIRSIDNKSIDTSKLFVIQIMLAKTQVKYVSLRRFNTLKREIQLHGEQRHLANKITQYQIEVIILQLSGIRALYYGQDYSRALKCFNNALEIVKNHPESDVLQREELNLRLMIAEAYENIGAMDEVENMYREIIGDAKTKNEHWLTYLANYNLAMFYKNLGENNLAVERLQESLAIAQKNGYYISDYKFIIVWSDLVPGQPFPKEIDRNRHNQSNIGNVEYEFVKYDYELQTMWRLPLKYQAYRVICHLLSIWFPLLRPPRL